ncbi:MAG: carbohydrate-binding domain-containing protein [Bacteroidales bacterium]|nr:carbohydrate-binding domain-containing protein [Bacteroidales bacterium]
MRKFIFLLPLIMLFAGSCINDDPISLTDPELSWSAESCTASLESNENEFPTLINPFDLPVSFSSTNEAVATIDASGNVTLVAAGAVSIIANTAADKTYAAGSASYTLVVTSDTDDGAGTWTFPSTGDTGSEDDISNTSFTRMVTVNYSSAGASVTGYSASPSISVSISGNEVTVNNTGKEIVIYKLSGTATDGYFKLYSAKKMALLIDGLSLTNPDGAAINIQSGKRCFVLLEGSNTLSDGSSATYSSGDEDMKAVFFSEGQLCFSGSGSLTVNANNKLSKSGIVSDDYLRFMQSPSITVTSGVNAGHGMKANDYVRIGDGTLKITTSAVMNNGISSDDYVLVEGGVSTINVSGGVGYDTEDAEYKGSAGIKCDNYFGMTGGAVTIKNSGAGGKGVNAGSYDFDAENHTLSDSYISGGDLAITCTGRESNDVSAKGIKIGWATKSGTGEHAKVTGYAGNLTISGGSVNVSASGGEGIEAKGTLTITDGYVYGFSAYDDGINSLNDMTISGGYVCAWTTGTQTGADGFDANGNLYITGGVVYGVCTHGSPDVAFDANTEGGKKLYLQGGTLIAVGGLESGASITGSAYSARSWSKSTWYGLWDNSSNSVIAFKTPSSGNSLVVYSSGNSVTLKSGVNYSGTSIFGGNAYVPGTISGGNAVSLSTYTSSGGGPGGGGRPGW